MRMREGACAQALRDQLAGWKLDAERSRSTFGASEADDGDEAVGGREVRGPRELDLEGRLTSIGGASGRTDCRAFSRAAFTHAMRA